MFFILKPLLKLARMPIAYCLLPSPNDNFLYQPTYVRGNAIA
ncbi:MAG: hypothetical protein ACFB2X_13285 [Rivularia sp. (in: cyanobacteria)]